jgi:hypothetical protein
MAALALEQGGIAAYAALHFWMVDAYPEAVMAGIALLELLLLLLVLGLLVWAFGAGRSLPQKQSEQAHRLELALAEIQQQGEGLPHLREPLKQARQYGRDLRKLLPQLAELERFLQKPGLGGSTRDHLLARHNDLNRAFERGVAYLERLGAELVLASGTQEPPALAELPLFTIELREVLHPPAPHQG